jgi:hypothetical protein
MVQEIPDLLQMGWCECGAISKARLLLRSDPEDLLDVMHLAENVILC